MLTKKDICSVTELRTETLSLLSRLKEEKKPLFIVKRSKLQAVLADIDLWNQLTQKILTKEKVKDPLIEWRKKYVHKFAGFKATDFIRKARDSRWNLS